MSPIRPATLQDLPGVYRVCLETGDSGADATGLYRNPDLLGHVFVGPYVVGQADLAHVVADSDGVAGYLLAAADTRAFERWTDHHWWPTLRAQYPASDANTPDDELIRLIHSPPRAPDDVVAVYPAHLHIDLLGRVRGQGLGRALVELLLARLRERGSRGVHLDVAADNENGIAFYRHLGFTEVGRGQSSILMGLPLDGPPPVRRSPSP
jgi:ribosomal protein S18 acetylase RimI-like enzyme